MIGIILQARMGSTRLPGKMILPFYSKKGIFELLLSRIKGAKLGVPVILATTNNVEDDILVGIANRKKVLISRGSEEDVLDRFIKAAEQYDISKIIRLCADNPFIDLFDLERQIIDFKKSDFDYWCYATREGIPTIRTHYGFWAEGVKLSTLKKIKQLTSEKLYHEHVTNYIYMHSEQFSIYKKFIPKSLEYAKIRLTIDTLNDFEYSSIIYNEMIKCKIPIKAVEMAKFVKTNPYWLNVMENEIKKNQK